jgi:hypothetical protein
LTVALWLYAASSNFAGASTTYDLAYQHGIVWRSYYANRTPRQAIPNVGAMAAGDTLYLGYRDGGHIALVGRMRLGRPDQPEDVSPVFAAVPAVLLPDFIRYRYSDDPVLQRMVGLFVEEVEPISGTIQSPGRLTITKLSQDPLVAHRPPVRQPSHPVDAASMAFAFSTRQSEERPVTAEGSFVGVDVAGRSNKGYDLCNLVWSKGAPVLVRFERLPHATPLPPTSSLRRCVADGDFRELAELTHDAAASTAEAFWSGIIRLARSAPSGVFIDSPSGFARNVAGHGRLTEKQSITGVSFQSTPSISCNTEHGADWGWLLYGMVAFAACLHEGHITLAQWTEALREGLLVPTSSGSLVVRECFPTATVSRLRSRGRGAYVQQLLAELKEHEAERRAVAAYLDLGVRAVKQPRQSLFDRADALVAALSSLPYGCQEFTESMSWPAVGSTRWRPGVASAHLAEGAIALPA